MEGGGGGRRYRMLTVAVYFYNTIYFVDLVSIFDVCKWDYAVVLKPATRHRSIEEDHMVVDL